TDGLYRGGEFVGTADGYGIAGRGTRRRGRATCPVPQVCSSGTSTTPMELRGGRARAHRGGNGSLGGPGAHDVAGGVRRGGTRGGCRDMGGRELPGPQP